MLCKQNKTKKNTNQVVTRTKRDLFADFNSIKIRHSLTSVKHGCSRVYKLPKKKKKNTT